MYNHNKAQQSKNRVHISWDILYAHEEQNTGGHDASFVATSGTAGCYDDAANDDIVGIMTTRAVSDDKDSIISNFNFRWYHNLLLLLPSGPAADSPDILALSEYMGSHTQHQQQWIGKPSRATTPILIIYIFWRNLSLAAPKVFERIVKIVKSSK